MKPSTVLKKARKLIERGWCRYTKSRRFRVDGPMHYCAIGAIEKAGGNTEHRDILRQAIGSGIVRFNDSDGRKKADVLRAFDRAIKLAVSEGK